MGNVHIIGAGGIGVALGWHLARGGWEVTMVEADAAKLQAGRARGLALDGVPEARAHWVDFADWTPPERTLVLLCTKTFDNAAVLAKLPERGLLIPVQNGFDPLLEKSTHPFEGIASFVSQCERQAPETRITRAGELHLGGRKRLATYQRDVLENLAAGLRAGGMIGVHIVSTITPYKAAKLMYNAAISPLAAAGGIDNEGLLSDPLAQRLFFALLRENYAILRRSGAKLAKIGPLHPAVVNRILSLPWVGQSLARFFRPGLRGTYCSMAPDIRTGRTEITAYNGYLQRLARGTACPINTAVLEMMSNIKARNLEPGRDLLVGLGNSVGIGAL